MMLLSVIASMRGDILLEQGNAEESLSIQDEVLRTRRELSQRSRDAQMLFAVASAHVSRGNALLGLGRAEEAALDFATAMDAFGSVNRIHEDPIYARQSRVVAAIRRGDALAAMGRKQACRSLWQEAMREAERLHAEDSHSALALGNLNEARRRLGLAPRDGSVPSLPDPRLPAASVP